MRGWGLEKHYKTRGFGQSTLFFEGGNLHPLNSGVWVDMVPEPGCVTQAAKWEKKTRCCACLEGSRLKWSMLGSLWALVFWAYLLVGREVQNCELKKFSVFRVIFEVSSSATSALWISLCVVMDFLAEVFGGRSSAQPLAEKFAMLKLPLGTKLLHIMF